MLMDKAVTKNAFPMKRQRDNYEPLSHQEREIVATIAGKLGERLNIIQIQEKEGTARARKKIITEAGEKQFIIELAATEIEKFYLERSIEQSQIFQSAIKYAIIRVPIMTGEHRQILYAVYPYISGSPSKRDYSGENILKNFYTENSCRVSVCDATIKKIEDQFVASWPSQFEFFIRNHQDFIRYRNLLSTYNEITLCAEHGDFARTNIIENDSARYLIDLEFSRLSQPIGFDLFFYNRTTHKYILFGDRKYYYKKLHAIRYKLNNEINWAIDNNLTDIIIYNTIEKGLKQKLKQFLSDHHIDAHPVIELLRKSTKRFSNQFFVTIWDNDQLSGFAAFNKRFNILSPVCNPNKKNAALFFLKDTHQMYLLIAYLRQYRLGLYIRDVTKGSLLYNLITELTDSVQNDPDREGLRADYAAIARTADGQESVTFFRKGNKKRIYKYFESKISYFFRQTIRCLRAYFAYILDQLPLTKWMGFLYYYPKNRVRWRKSRKRGGALFLKVGNLTRFFETLNRHNIDYVVLRGLHDSSTLRQNDAKEDIDLLLKATQILKVIRIASLFPGKRQCDFYFDMLQSVNRHLYYPPSFAFDILASKKMHPLGYYEPDEYTKLWSLLYHITYHKGCASGFQTDKEDFAEKPKHLDTLLSLIDACEIKWPFKYTLIGFHEYLKSIGYNMIYDLIEKWPNRHLFLDFLLNYEKEQLKKYLSYTSELIIFIIRDDATEERILNYIQSEISARFKVLFFAPLDHDQVERAIRYTRGGNWVEKDHKRYHMVQPSHIMLCVKKSETAGSQSEPGVVKEHIRQNVNRLFPRRTQRYALHSSDSVYESFDYIKAIFPSSYKEILNKIRDDVPLKQGQVPGD